VTMSMVWVMVLANAIAVAVAFVALKPLARLTYIRGTLLVPFLVVLLGIGAYTSSNSYFDVFVMLAASAIGVLAIRFDWPRVPFLLAVILGAIAERYLFLSYSLSGLDWLADPIVIGLFLISIAAVVRPLIKNARARRRSANGSAAAPEAATTATAASPPTTVPAPEAHPETMSEKGAKQ
jgi:putative tricarboxylic transport membrane protein